MHDRQRIGQWMAAATVAVAAMFVAAWAIRWQLPGHISMDASMQFYEAHIGRSVTWNPPYMTAMIRWLGAGEQAAIALVWINSLATYLALGLLAAHLLAPASQGHERADVGAGGPGGWSLPVRAVLVVALLANPVLFLYVGILWKDVLFSSFMLVGAALGLAAAASGRRASWVLAILSVIVLAVGMKVRQQGVFMSPVLLLIPMIAVSLGRGLGRRRTLIVAVGMVVLFALSSMLASALVSRTIQTGSEYGNQVGFRGLMQYDTLGMMVESSIPTDQLPFDMTEEVRDEARRVYSVYRGDFMWYSPEVTQWLGAPYELVRQRWWAMLKADPAAYLRHKTGAFRALLNVDGVRACLPVHVGIDGNHELLRTSGFVPGVDAKDRRLWGLSQDVIAWPIYRHWVYLVALVVAGVALLVVPMAPRLRAGALVLALASGLLYASFLPTSIACDFRYLFAAICLVSLLWVVIITSAFAAGMRYPWRWRSPRT